MERASYRWPDGPNEILLTANEVHLWSVDLSATDERVAAMRALLSRDELGRADRFKFPRHRRRFTVARGVLRQILGRYFGLQPTEIEFLTTKYGKPFVRHLLGGWECSFNLSHSHELALLGVTVGRRIGVDLEHRRRIVDMESIAKHFFSSAEVATLLATPAAKQQQVFLNCWTRKEAYIKGIGQGLSHPLSTFRVSMRVGDPARLEADEGEPEAVDRWRFCALDPHADYVAAVAVESPRTGESSADNWTLSRWHWTE